VEDEEQAQIRAAFLEYHRNRDPDLRTKLIESHLGLVHHLAQRFEGRREPIEDLIQVGSLALVKAVDRFDPTRGLEFSTFAVPTILGELKRHFRDKGWSVRVPRRIQELHVIVGGAIGELTQELGRSPTVDELADRTGLAPDDVVQALDAASAYQSASLEAPGSHDPNAEPIGARLGAEDPALESVDARPELAALLRCLSPRERTIIGLRFFEGLTQSEIASRVGISQMHVSRLLARALARLHQAATAGQGAPTDESSGSGGTEPG